jgi:hypothetical protein
MPRINPTHVNDKTIAPHLRCLPMWFLLENSDLPVRELPITGAGQPCRGRTLTTLRLLALCVLLCLYREQDARSTAKAVAAPKHIYTGSALQRITFQTNVRPGRKDVDIQAISSRVSLPEQL